MLSEEECKILLDEMEKLQPLHVAIATTDDNAPLALVQVSIKSQCDMLRTVLELDFVNYHQGVGDEGTSD